MWDVPDSLCRQPPLLARLLLELQFGVAADPVVDLPLDARLDFTPGKPVIRAALDLELVMRPRQDSIEPAEW